MTTPSQTFRFIPIKAATTPKIYNLTSPATANDEFSQLLIDGTKKILIRCRGKAEIKFTLESGKSNTIFVTIPKNTSYNREGLDLNSKTLYMRVSEPSQVIEIETWS